MTYIAWERKKKKKRMRNFNIALVSFLPLWIYSSEAYHTFWTSYNIRRGKSPAKEIKNNRLTLSASYIYTFIIQVWERGSIKLKIWRSFCFFFPLVLYIGIEKCWTWMFYRRVKRKGVCNIRCGLWSVKDAALLSQPHAICII